MIKNHLVGILNFFTNTIRKKLIICFIVIIVPCMFLSIYTFFSGRVLIDNYNSILKKHILINEIFINTRITHSYLNSYLVSGSPNALLEYNNTYLELFELVETLKCLVDYQSLKRPIIDLENMFHTYIDEANTSIELMNNNKRKDSYSHYEEAKKVIDLIEGTYKNVSFSFIDNSENFIRETIIKKNRQYALNGILIALFGLLSIFFIQRVSLTITKPLKKLTSFASQYPVVNKNIYELKTTNDEVGILTQTFKKMIKKINLQILEIKEKAKVEKKLRDEEIENLKIKSLLKDIELKSLQLQINPHFLFNSLNLISQMAYLENANKTSSLINSMSELLRYNLDKFDKIVCIEDEIQNIYDYIYIQQERFGERIRFDIKADEKTNKYQIPCLIIQPLIENSIIHGVQSYVEKGHIGVRITKRHKRIILRVYDNGKGIKRKKLYELNEHLKNNDYTSLNGIGLSNIVGRLHIFFNDSLQIRIKSTEEKLTIVRIEFPAVKKEEKNVQINNC